MTPGLLTAVDPRHEADLVAALEVARQVRVVRRCADVPELVSVAAAGAAELAVVSATFRGIDREVLRTLAGHGVRVIGMCERADEVGERSLRQWGISTIIHPDTAPEDLAGALVADGPDPVAASSRVGDPGANAPGSGAWPAGADAQALAGPGDGRSEEPRSRPPTPHDARPGGGPGSRGEDAPGGRDPNAVHEESPGRVLAVWGPLGSPGRTTLAIALAAELAADETNVLVIDADTWGASVGQVLGLIDEAPGLAAAARLSEQAALDALSLARIAPEVAPHLRVLTGLPRADRWPEARAAAVEDLLRVARLVAEVVIVDCGFAVEDDEELSYDTVAPRRNAATLTVLEAADHVLLVGAADPVGLQRLARASEDLATRSTAPRTVVVNKVRKAVDGPGPERAIAEVLGRFSGLTDLLFLPWSPAECDLALWEGRTLREVAPQSALVRELRSVLAQVAPGHVSRATSGRSRRRRGV